MAPVSHIPPALRDDGDEPRRSSRPATAPTIADDRSPARPSSGDPYLDTVVADRYRILKKLGEGGMGVVYLAEHVIIEKKVALKILSEDFARKADLVQRFMQEAKAASRIGHENIVDITDFGETPSGSVFFAMEYLDGGDLAQHIRAGGPMPLARARYIVTQICRALGAAHNKGIIHRDIKPENIFLVEREGRGDFVKVLDFGIAKMSTMEEGGSRLTRTGMIFGTPEYMSPEQAKGDRPDHRVDIYAVGCILYEILTGDVPFHADTFMGVLTKHMFEPPVPPSQIAPQMGIPLDVEQVVMKALHKDRDHRFQTMKDFSLALAECGGGDAAEGWKGEPSSVSAITEMNRDPSREQRHGVGSQAAVTLPPPRSRGRTLGAITGVLVLAGGAYAAWSILHTPAPPPVQPKVEPVVVRPVVTPPPLLPAPPKSFHMTVRSTPPEAEIFRGNAVIGRTPSRFELPAGDHPVKLVLRKKGFVDHPFELTPTSDQSADLELQGVKPPPPPHKGGHAAHLPSPPPVKQVAEPPREQPPPTKPVVAPPAQQPPPKPNAKLRDLKDPFSGQ